MRRLECLFIAAAMIVLNCGTSLANDRNFSGFSLGVLTEGTLVSGNYQLANWGFDFEGLGAGLYAGVDQQVDMFVFGFDADLGVIDADDIVYSTWANVDVRWRSHIRAKAGLLVSPNALMYLTAGLAMAEIKFDDTFGPEWGDDTNILYGLTVGAGLAVLMNNNLTLRLEYLYDYLGDDKYTITKNGIPYYTSSLKDMDMHTLRVGVMYLF